MQFEYYLFDEVAEILIVDSPDVANPSVSVGLSFFAEGEGEGSVDVGENDLLFFSVVVVGLALYVHDGSNIF